MQSIKASIFALIQGTLLILVADVLHRGQSAHALPASGAIDPRDSICYMEMANGRVLDLSRICGVQNSRPVSLAPLDQRLMNDYQAALNRRYRQSPAAQSALAQSRQNPQAVLQRARDACARIQGGMLPELALLSEGRADSAVVNRVALSHYCPELDD